MRKEVKNEYSGTDDGHHMSDNHHSGVNRQQEK